MDLTQLTPLLVPLGTILGAAVALAGTYVAQRNLWNLDVLKDARSLRDAKRERLRALYELAVVTCSDLRSLGGRVQIVESKPQVTSTKIGAKPPPAGMDPSFRAFLNSKQEQVRFQVIAELVRIRVRLSLEPEAAAVVLIVDDVISGRDLPYLFRDLQAAMQRSLVGLEQPIRQL